MKKKVIVGAIIFLFLFIQLLYYNPFTPIGAVRWSVRLKGFVIKSYMIKVEYIPRSEIKIGTTLSPADFTKAQTIYHITSPDIRDSITLTELTYYVVTDRKNGLYHAEFTGY